MDRKGREAVSNVHENSLSIDFLANPGIKFSCKSQVNIERNCGHIENFLWLEILLVIAMLKSLFQAPNADIKLVFLVNSRTLGLLGSLQIINW